MGISLENASDVRIKELQVVNCSTGIRVFNANNISINNFSIDSCQYTGMQIDSTQNSYFQGTVWNNNKAYVNNNEYGILIVKYSCMERCFPELCLSNITFPSVVNNDLCLYPFL